MKERVGQCPSPSKPSPDAHETAVGRGAAMCTALEADGVNDGDCQRARRDSVVADELEDLMPALAHTTIESFCEAVSTTPNRRAAHLDTNCHRHFRSQSPSHPCVLPIFSRDLFEENAEYDTLSPALKLASRLLQTPQVIHFLHAIFFGANTPAPQDEEGQEHELLLPVRALHDLTHQDRKVVSDELAAMSAVVTYRFRTLDPQDRSESWQGLATGTPSHAHGGRRKVNSLISIAQKFVDAMKPSYEPVENKRRENVFCLATILIHEIAHAAQNWAVGGAHGCDYFEQVTAAPPETVYEMERQIFGGPVYFPLGDEYAHGGPPMVIDWPGSCSVATSEHGSCDPTEDRGRWPIDRIFIRRLLDDKWWRDVMAAQSFQMLIPPSVRKHLILSRATRMKSGLPRSVEKLCSPGRRKRVDYWTSTLNDESIVPRVAAKPPRFDPCCEYWQDWFQDWVAGFETATQQSWQLSRLCLPWLRTPDDGSPSENFAGMPWGISPENVVRPELRTRFQEAVATLGGRKDASLQSLDMRELEALTTHFMSLKEIPVKDDNTVS